jgi:hypothetical protein
MTTASFDEFKERRVAPVDDIQDDSDVALQQDVQATSR